MHTGNIPIESLRKAANAVYPCAYREHLSSMYTSKQNNGLSLCIQGTCLIMFNASDSVRFIPVHTGNIIEVLPVMPPVVGLSLCIQGT